MALTVRTNGSGGSNVITSAWFNDYYNLLTGGMQDQEVSLKGNLQLLPFGPDPSTALSGVAVAGSGLNVGTYVYYYTFLTPNGESSVSPSTTVVTTTGNQQVNLSSIPTGTSPGTTGRNIYRTIAGGTVRRYVATINDNTTTAYTDTITDTALINQGRIAPTASTYGGSLVLKDTTGSNIMAILSHDGTLSLNPPSQVLHGSYSGTMTMWQFNTGTYKNIALLCQSFRNTGGSAQNMAFPSPFTQFVKFYTDGAAPFQFLYGGNVQNAMVFTSLASAGGAISTQSTVYNFSIGAVQASVDTISFINQTGTIGNNGTIFLEGV